MPYSSLAELPEAAKRLSAKKQRAWMQAFNSTYKKHGEEKAFRVAWSVVGRLKKHADHEEAYFPNSMIKDTLASSDVPLTVNHAFKPKRKRQLWKHGNHDQSSHDVQKHLQGQHDQKTHGRWAHGGGLASRSYRVKGKIREIDDQGYVLTASGKRDGRYKKPVGRPVDSNLLDVTYIGEVLDTGWGVRFVYANLSSDGQTRRYGVDKQGWIIDMNAHNGIGTASGGPEIIRDHLYSKPLLEPVPEKPETVSPITSSKQALRDIQDFVEGGRDGLLATGDLASEAVIYDRQSKVGWMYARRDSREGNVIKNLKQANAYVKDILDKLGLVSSDFTPPKVVWMSQARKDWWRRSARGKGRGWLLPTAAFYRHDNEIALNQRIKNSRTHETLAHETAHWLLHKLSAGGMTTHHSRETTGHGAEFTLAFAYIQNAMGYTSMSTHLVNTLASDYTPPETTTTWGTDDEGNLVWQGVEVVEIEKHAQHDQSTHGNWARGSWPIGRGIGVLEQRDGDRTELTVTDADGSSRTYIDIRPDQWTNPNVGRITFDKMQEPSEEQLDALWYYKGKAGNRHDHTTINDFIRHGKRVYWRDDQSKEDHEIDQALLESTINILKDYASPLRDNLIVYRGIKRSFKGFEDLEVGSVFQDKGFVSTTDASHTYMFKKDFARKAVFRISVPRGTKAISFPDIPVNRVGTKLTGEGEILLEPGLRFRVNKISKSPYKPFYFGDDKDILMYDVEVISPSESVQKHYQGRHDQKSHGNWARGGGRSEPPRDLAYRMFTDDKGKTHVVDDEGWVVGTNPGTHNYGMRDARRKKPVAPPLAEGEESLDMYDVHWEYRRHLRDDEIRQAAVRREEERALREEMGQVKAGEERESIDVNGPHRDRVMALSDEIRALSNQYTAPSDIRKQVYALDAAKASEEAASGLRFKNVEEAKKFMLELVDKVNITPEGARNAPLIRWRRRGDTILKNASAQYGQTDNTIKLAKAYKNMSLTPAIVAHELAHWMESRVRRWEGSLWVDDDHGIGYVTSLAFLYDSIGNVNFANQIRNTILPEGQKIPVSNPIRPLYASGPESIDARWIPIARKKTVEWLESRLAGDTPNEDTGEVVQKHLEGQHDQSSHGNWAVGGKYKEVDFKRDSYVHRHNSATSLADESIVTDATRESIIGYAANDHGQINDYLEHGEEYVRKDMREAFENVWGVDYDSDLNEIKVEIPQDRIDWMERNIDDRIVEIKSIIEQIDPVLDTSTLKENMLVYKGAKDLSHLKKGQLFRDLAYVSTSMVENIGDNFARGKSGTLLRIRVPAGTKSLDVNSFLQLDSPNAKERELLLHRGTAFKVIDVVKEITYDDEGYYKDPGIIDVEVVTSEEYESYRSQNAGNPIQKHLQGQHDQSTHGSWADHYGSQFDTVTNETTRENWDSMRKIHSYIDEAIFPYISGEELKADGPEIYRRSQAIGNAYARRDKSYAYYVQTLDEANRYVGDIMKEIGLAGNSPLFEPPKVVWMSDERKQDFADRGMKVQAAFYSDTNEIALMPDKFARTFTILQHETAHWINHKIETLIPGAEQSPDLWETGGHGIQFNLAFAYIRRAMGEPDHADDLVGSINADWQMPADLKRKR